MAQLQKKSNEKPGILYTDIGSNIQPVYNKVFNKETGKSLVVKTDEFDIDEFIQASNCKTDLSMLRAEMISTGQLPTIGDEIVDATLMPENIHDVFNAVNQVGDIYNSLPASIKSIFKDKDDFMASLIKDTYAARVTAGLQQAYEKQAVQTQTAEEKKEGNE